MLLRGLRLLLMVVVLLLLLLLLLLELNCLPALPLNVCRSLDLVQALFVLDALHMQLGFSTLLMAFCITTGSHLALVIAAPLVLQTLPVCLPAPTLFTLFLFPASCEFRSLGLFCLQLLFHVFNTAAFFFELATRPVELLPFRLGAFELLHAGPFEVLLPASLEVLGPEEVHLLLALLVLDDLELSHLMAAALVKGVGVTWGRALVGIDGGGAGIRVAGRLGLAGRRGVLLFLLPGTAVKLGGKPWGRRLLVVVGVVMLGERVVLGEVAAAEPAALLGGGVDEGIEAYEAGLGRGGEGGRGLGGTASEDGGRCRAR